MVGGKVEFCREGYQGLCAVGVDEPEPGPEAECAPSGENLAGGTAVTASSSLADRPPELAVDGDIVTGWGAGAGPEQWIEIDLGQEYELTCLRLLVDQFPAGRTVHRVTGGTEPGHWLELPGSWVVRYLRVTTVESPSWVAWLEVEARGAAP